MRSGRRKRNDHRPPLQIRMGQSKTGLILDTLSFNYLKKMYNESENKPPSFLVDGMLGSTARKLRILGFDTAYNPNSTDSELLEAASNAQRHLVTCDVDLYCLSRRRRIPAILVSAKSEEQQLCEVLSKCGIEHIEGLPRISRCSICNGKLALSSKDARGREVYSCDVCGRQYWRGSHWKKLSAFFDNVDTLLRRAKSLGSGK